MSAAEIVVLKFGSSVLRSEHDLTRVVQEIYRLWRTGEHVVVVVSAFGDTTDRLLDRATSICAEPDEVVLAALLATGETAAAALLALALQRAGIPAKVFDAAKAGLRTTGSATDAELIALDTERLRLELPHFVIVLPGFVGRDDENRTTLLGRGGSDFTAAFVAHKIGGRCLLIKDVDGLYVSDPAKSSKRPGRFREVTYETAHLIGSPLIQTKAIKFAAAHRLSLAVACIGADSGTKIGCEFDRIARPNGSKPPLNVALLGCGVVGGGVYERVRALPEAFIITGVGVRDRKRIRFSSVSDKLLTEELDELIDRPCDVVVELIGGTTRAYELVRRALSAGRHVVTANKALLATYGDELQSIALENRVVLYSSAAVGGALPALETIERAKAIGPIRAISGVLNATANFVLDEIAADSEFADAISAAQKSGYAEADPSLDLDGTDTAQKLIILARSAFGASLPLESIQREGIQGLTPADLQAARDRATSVRLIATCWRTAHGLEARVAPMKLPLSHPLASVAGAQNRILVELVSGETFMVSGAGAGRWPTTAAVIADLMDIRREIFAERKEIAHVEEECVA
jgi:homoserine dehydrogenase